MGLRSSKMRVLGFHEFAIAASRESGGGRDDRQRRDPADPVMVLASVSWLGARGAKTAPRAKVLPEVAPEADDGSEFGNLIVATCETMIIVADRSQKLDNKNLCAGTDAHSPDRWCAPLRGGPMF